MSERKIYIDIVKGLSILAITFLHYEDGVIPPGLNTWIGSWMITAFYFTSGWQTGLSDKNDTIKELIKKRGRSLGIPYLWFSFIILLFDMILVAVGYYEPKVVLVDLYKALCLRGIGTLWFLPALFGGEIICAYMKRRRHWQKGLFLLVCIGYFLLYNHYISGFRSVGDWGKMVDAPLYAIRNMLNSAIIIYVGYTICLKWKNKLSVLSTGKLSLLSTGLLLLSYFLAVYLHAILPDSVDKDVVWMFFSPIIGPFGLVTLSFLLEKWAAVNRFFVFWGKNSLVLMATHYSILLVLCKMIHTAITGASEFTGMVTIYYFVASVIIEYPIVYFINKRAKFILGK